VESGARNVDHILTRTLLPEVAREFLAHMATGETIATVHVAVDAEGGFQYEIS
jgi:type VI secretion system protein VasG